MDELVQQLADGRHPVEVRLRPERTIEAFRESLGRDYVHIKFTDTQGGTELGVAVDRVRSQLDPAHLDSGTGRVTVVGDLTLNFVKVRCIADIDLASFTGEGHLEPLGEVA
jgi:hypothetical protein